MLTVTYVDFLCEEAGATPPSLAPLPGGWVFVFRESTGAPWGESVLEKITPYIVCSMCVCSMQCMHLPTHAWQYLRGDSGY